MVSEIVMPRLGWTMERGTVVQWLKADGETVAIGDVVLEVEGDKAVSEVEALDGGILRLPPDGPAVGDEVAVGTVLAYLVPSGARAPFEEAAGGAAKVAVAQPTDGGARRGASDATPLLPQVGRNGNGNGTTATPAISPRARRVAAELGMDWMGLHGSGSTGRIVERDVRAALHTAETATAPAIESAANERGPRISPLARRAAEAAGVDLAQVAPRTSDARISRADVATAQATHAAYPALAAPVPPVAPVIAVPAGQAAAALGAARRVTAERMATSAHTAAPVTLTTDADATELVRLRSQLRELGGDAPLPSYNDLLTRLVALALVEHPALNASWGDDGGVVRHDAVHVGVAVETERGLLVPVIRDAHAKSVGQIAAESAAIIARARVGRATPDELRGGTFTITNLGPYEIDAFTPIINLPECAILGVGRIASRAVVVDEETGAIAARKMLALSLTFDHRVVDGAPAARFLQRIRRFVEQPLLWLLR